MGVAQSHVAVVPRGDRPRARLVAHQRLVGEALRSLLQQTQELSIAPVETIEDAPGLGHGDADVILADVAGFDAAERRLVDRLGPPGVRPPIVLLVDRVDATLIQEAMRAGVEGVLDREASASAFVMAIKQVLAGQSVFPTRAVGSLSSSVDATGLRALSNRQRDVLRLIAEGYSNEEIGRQLYISVNTVKFHVREIFRKLRLRNRVQAAQRYAELRAVPEREPPPAARFD